MLVDNLRYCARDESITNLLLQLVPCILHLETIFGLKLLTILMEDWPLEHAHGVYPNVANVNSEKERIKIF